MDLILMGGQSLKGDVGLIDVPNGPMRQLKHATKFDFMASNQDQKSKQFKTLSTSPELSQRTSNYSAATSPYEAVFEAANAQRRKTEQSLDQILGHETMKNLSIDLSSVNAFDKQIIESTLQQIKYVKTAMNPNFAFQDLHAAFVNNGVNAIDLQ